MVTPGTRWTISGSAAAGIASISFFVTTEVAAAASSRGSGTRAVTTISSRATWKERKSRKRAGAITLGVFLRDGSLPSLLPDAGDCACPAASADGGKAENVLDRPQHVVVRHGHGTRAVRDDVLADDDRGDVIARRMGVDRVLALVAGRNDGLVILIPRDDE